MNQKLIFSRLWILLLGVVLGLGSCTNDDTKSTPFTLYYMSMDDIGQSMTAPLASPTYQGGTPSDFTIDRVTFNGDNINNESFQINPKNGAISVSNTAELQMGVYKTTISCLSGGSRHSFNDAFIFSLGKLYPQSLAASPEVISIAYPTNPLDDNPVAQISVVGECVTTTNFVIVQPKDQEYFSTTKNGEVTLNTKFKGEVPPGDHTLTIKVINAGGSKEYSNVVTFKITSAPLDLSYAISANKAEIGQKFQSSEPNLKGTKDDIVYAIAEILPATTTSGIDINTIISIDPSTGIIKGDDSAKHFTEGESYKISVEATNKFGRRIFNNVFTLEVVGFIQPIENFSYAATTKTQATAYTIDKVAGFKGDDPRFTFENLADNLKGQLTIDETTGVVSALKANTIPIGNHNITVKATNAKGSVTATLALTIEANPNYFTYIRYGNNLGVDAATNANQFRFATFAEMTSFLMPTPTTDAATSIALKWSVKLKHKMVGTAIDENSGALTITTDAVTNQGGLVMVTATAGVGTESEYSVTVPVFFLIIEKGKLANGEHDQNLTITYTPFVFQCNPRRGGISPCDISITDRTTSAAYTGPMSIDYRRTWNYYNFNGPVTHIDGGLSGKDLAGDRGKFLCTIWLKWGAQFNEKDPGYNGGAKAPITYYFAKATPATSLTQQMLYVDRTNNFKVNVNPGKWVDDNDSAANGAFFAQMTCEKTDAGGDINNGQQTFPLWIWFDEKF